ncbi:phosphate acyltransferase PlsX [Candidatus Paracaedibacter symbiosus]|uniref:phosphate acyltransferase PlsX n=1 Tax=Candidatus Paracaedibacter symbiosus TaxID=244582 RepID=UPI000509A056|nr:phosphate acyltransferase PlsX [Candidatus Paracaedibacter symbiosus]
MAINIALDAMGGDAAPAIVVEGASLAIERGLDCHFHMFGDASRIDLLLRSFPLLQDKVMVHHTDEAIPGDMKPAVAIRTLKRSSMRLAVQSVADGVCQAVVSAGNTGAYMALSKILLHTLSEIDRPAIAAKIPTIKGFCIGLDLGANVDCSFDNLVQFAVMGESLACRLLGKERPTVGLLNVGTEEQKGDVVVQEAAQLLKESDQINFIGFVEGDDITMGKADVVVTDGFTGNIALKSMEGAVRLLFNLIKGSLSATFLGRLGYWIASSAFKNVRNKMDPRLHNGAVFLGLRSAAVKSHGGADALAFCYAIDVAASIASEIDSVGMGQEIENKLQQIYGASL